MSVYLSAFFSFSINLFVCFVKFQQKKYMNWWQVPYYCNYDEITLKHELVQYVIVHLYKIKKKVEWSHKAVVLNLFSIEPQGFGESVSGFRRQEILNNKTKKKILDTHFILPTTKGSIIARMELVGFSTSNKRITLDLNTADIYIHTVIIIHSQGGIQPALPVLLCSSWGVVVALLFCHKHGT